MITVPASFISDLNVVLSVAEQGESQARIAYLLECIIAMLIPEED